LLTNTKL